MKANRHFLFILLLGTALIGSAHAGGYGQTNVKPPPPKDLPPPPPAPESKQSKVRYQSPAIYTTSQSGCIKSSQ
jgi:hypothetical protein